MSKGVCKCCGQINCESHYCRWFRTGKGTFKKFNLDLTKVGSSDIFQEFNSLKDLLFDLYFRKGYSFPKIKSLYGVDSTSLDILFSLFNFSRRSLSESRRLVILQSGILNCSHKFHHGKHVTWNNKIVYYRSSYELTYCKLLDLQQIDYDVEGIRLKYWDSVKRKLRIAVPDFHLPLSRTLVEVKSGYTYNYQNIVDKFVSYKLNNFNPILVLEGKVLEPKQFSKEELYALEKEYRRCTRTGTGYEPASA